MCTRPITLTKTFPNGKVKQYTVPCGKCPECRVAYQSEFAFMSFLEAEKRGSLHMFTLTYNNSNLPVAISTLTEDLVIKVVGFSRGVKQSTPWDKKCCPVVLTNNPDYSICPSLYREDVKLWLKKCRSYCDRHGLSKDFSFTCFGEYGEERKRPHYHLLFAGLAPDQARIFSNLWTNGFSLVKAIPRFNKDGSDAFTLCADYVSKYISKRDRLPDFVKHGFAEIPRRQSSIGFGKDLDFTKLRPFI